jgi:transposase InsO family protein
LTLKALEMAVQRRCPEPGLLHHSDRGCTYTCEDYQTYLAGRGITCSMSRRGDCYDNAVILRHSWQPHQLRRILESLQLIDRSNLGRGLHRADRKC